MNVLPLTVAERQYYLLLQQSHVHKHGMHSCSAQGKCSWLEAVLDTVQTLTGAVPVQYRYLIQFLDCTHSAGLEPFAAIQDPCATH